MSITKSLLSHLSLGLVIGTLTLIGSSAVKAIYKFYVSRATGQRQQKSALGERDNG